MKKIIGLICFATLLLAGCDVNELENLKSRKGDCPTFHASFGDSADETTKTYVDEDMSLRWTEDDRLSIFVGNTYNHEYKYDGETGANNGSFSAISNPEFIAAEPLEANYAVYPYNPSNEMSSDGSMSVILPSVQKYAQNSFGLGANTMVAATENKEDNFLQFKNLCGYVVVKLYGEGTVTSIKLEGNDGEKISGKADVQAAFGTLPSVTMSEEATTSITLDCGDGVALGTTAETATEFWLCVPPVTFSKGFTVTATKDDGWQMIKSTSSSKEVVRNTKNALTPIEAVFDQKPDNSAALAQEREALMAIYDAVSEESKTILSNGNWGSDKPVSSWDFLIFNSEGNVIELILGETDFIKAIPPEIRYLKKLKRIFIYGTNFSNTLENPRGIEGCTIPNEVGELSELEEFYIRGDFVGCIPKEFSKLKKLKSLAITETGISGEIPKEIGDIETLEVLYLAFNPLTGKIPSELGKLSNLRSLILHGRESQISGSLPIEICNLPKLEELYLGGQLSGEIPHEIGNLKKLKRLVVNWSNIGGELPMELGNLTNLVLLQIDDSPISGSIPSSLANCKNLEALLIEACPITGPLPKWISEIKSLKKLSFYMTNMSGTVPKEWAQCPLLWDINLSGCPNLYGSIPEELMEMDAFKYRWGNWVNGSNFNLIGVKIPAPDFNVVSLDGVPISSAEEYAKNKFTILYQWNYWCPCISETPKLVELYNKYHELGLNVIGWSDDDDEGYLDSQPMRETIAKYGMPWHNFVVPAGERDGYGVFGNVANKYPGNIAGAIALVDEDGYIIWSNLYDSMENLEKIIDRYYEGTPTIYSSTDYSSDGVVYKLQSASEGKGINVILMGDGFTDKQIADGTYHDIMNTMKNSFFQEEPFASSKQFFNVYEVTVVSENEYKDNGNTSLKTWLGDGTLVGGNNSRCIDYALKAIDSELMDDAIIVVAINSTAYAGTCYMYNISEGDYGKGLAVSYFPIGEDNEQIANLIHHEAGGHGFAKLGDEYAYEYMGAIPYGEMESTKQMEPYGWYKNVDFTSDPTQVKWSKFLSDERYANEGLGCFEGGLTYWSGVWRPTDYSIMRYNTGGFNAPSREAIWYRIHKLAYGEEWQYNYEDFVTYDAINRTPAAQAASRAKVAKAAAARKGKPFQPLHEPVIVKHSWRDAVNNPGKDGR
ncbi:MAG: M64 family metallo-endopeptidase [Bacteroidaceae bacterium]|nr:M64 family metallo-endopeptidase [Bacteroidaceae bacterium]